MAELLVNGHTFDIELIVFDKDGVLIDFDKLWGKRVQSAVAALVQRCDGSVGLQIALYRSLGFDPKTKQVVADSPLAMASNAELEAIVASVLGHYGLDRPNAERLVGESFARLMGAPPEAEEIQPLGDLPGLFAQLGRAGIHLAVVTSDDRSSTRATLDRLAVAQSVALLVCGDDSIPNKPAPDAIRHISTQTGVDPADMMVVGDTINDLLMGIAAGVGCCVGVLGGAGDRSTLSAYADVLVESIEELSVVEVDMDTVSFTRMADGTKEDYEFFQKLEEEFIKGLPDRLLAALNELKHSFSGYKVTRYEHSLQSASRAYRYGESEELVVAALLHDIGDALAPYSHGEMVAAILKPFMSEKSCWIVKYHGLFQMYYYAHHFGGDRNARDRYRDHEYYQATVDFCEMYDQNCFDPDYESLPIEFFEPMVRRIFSEPRYLGSG